MTEDDRRDPLSGVPDPQDHRPQGYERPTPEQEKARKKRNMVIAWALAAFCLFVFVITIVNLQQNGILDRPL